jgi:hypothetical protein
MAKKFAHLTAQMKTEKRISRQLDGTNLGTLTTLASISTTTTTTTSPRNPGLQRSCSSGSSSTQSPLRHSTSCRHHHQHHQVKIIGQEQQVKPSASVDRVDLGKSSASPNLASSQQHSSSQDTDGGNESSSSTSNQVSSSFLYLKFEYIFKFLNLTFRVLFVF